MAENKIYRKSAIEKLSNPEQLDRAVTVSSPLSWLALIGVALLILATCLWAFFGTLPTTVTVTGIAADPQSACAVYADCAATSASVSVSVGTKIAKGDTVGTLTRSDSSTSTVYATQSGTVSEILVSADTENAEKIYPGTEILRYTPDVTKDQTVICYVPVATAAKLQTGMEVLLTVSGDDTLSGSIVNIGEYPASSTNAAYVLGSADNYYVNQIFSSGPVISVVCEADTNGKTFANGTQVNIKIVTDSCAPIEKLLTNLRNKSEG